MPRLAPEGPISPGGNGLFLISLTAVVEDVGVAWFEELGEWEFPMGLAPGFWDGDAVPEFASFLLFEVLFESLARESCSC